MKILGTERALVGEKIVLNISILKNGISKVLLSLSNSLRLIETFNYDLHKKYFSQKVLSFEISNFKFGNNLTLGFLSEKLEPESSNASIEIKALDIEENVKEMSIFDIEILKPEINVDITSGEKPEEYIIKLEKKNTEITTFFETLKVYCIDHNSKKEVNAEIIRFSEDEYIENLDKIPIIFDIDTAIKEIIIHSNSPVELSVQACYHDLKNNKYESNRATIVLQPIAERIKEEEFITTPIFNTIGFEFPEMAMATS